MELITIHIIIIMRISAVVASASWRTVKLSCRCDMIEKMKMRASVVVTGIEPPGPTTTTSKYLLYFDRH